MTIGETDGAGSVRIGMGEGEGMVAQDEAEALSLREKVAKSGVPVLNSGTEKGRRSSDVFIFFYLVIY